MYKYIISLLVVASLISVGHAFILSLKRPKIKIANNHELKVSMIENIAIENDMNPVTTDEDEYTDILPKETLSVIERLGRAAKFYSKAVPVFASYKLLDLKLSYFPEAAVDEDLQWNDLHDWGSDVITKAITDLKGFYPKTGQIIATRVDIFPEQYTSKLARTLDDLDPLPAKEIIGIDDTLHVDMMAYATLSFYRLNLATLF